MLDGKTIGVVVPAYNEQLLLPRTLETMPDFVDYMFVINDCSTDDTAKILDDFAERDPRIVPIHHEVNKGLGQSLIDGYVKARDMEVDVVAVMAGDNQMSPNDLEHVVRPIIDGDTDYVKGNRLLRAEVAKRMPRHRLIGNNILTLLTKFATGYWSSIDPQCGYTAISKEALAAIPIEKMTKGYGYNADILNMLNLSNFRVLDVEVEPVYGEEQSKIKIVRYTFKVAGLLLGLFFRRMSSKYMLRDFHPLFILYFFSMFNGLVLFVPFFLRFLWVYFTTGVAPQTTMTLMLFSLTFAVFSAVFAMWMDMEDNKRLNAQWLLSVHRR